jgi:hypothetical protein
MAEDWTELWSGWAGRWRFAASLLFSLQVWCGAVKLMTGLALFVPLSAAHTFAYLYRGYVYQFVRYHPIAQVNWIRTNGT